MLFALKLPARRTNAKGEGRRDAKSLTAIVFKTFASFSPFITLTLKCDSVLSVDMKPLTGLLLGMAVIAVGVLIVACKKGGPQADAEAAATRGEFQFIALLDPDGKWTYPEVPGIPDWYFRTTGVRVRQTKPETREADIAFMKSYNDALTQALKTQGKFHLVEENVAKVKANLGNKNTR
jgi:hypothetical protein